MKKPLLVSCIVLILLALSASAFGQKATRIKFAKGAAKANISASLNGYNDGRIYVIRVRSGQTLRTQQISRPNSLRYVTIVITDPSGNPVGDADASCNNRSEISPTDAGDYKIRVVECQKADPWRGTFTVKVTVR